MCLFGLPFEVSSAKLERSYRRAPRGAQSKNDDPAGICHLCAAGMPGSSLEWEDPYHIPLLEIFVCKLVFFFSVFKVECACVSNHESSLYVKTIVNPFLFDCC